MNSTWFFQPPSPSSLSLRAVLVYGVTTSGSCVGIRNLFPDDKSSSTYAGDFFLHYKSVNRDSLIHRHLRHAVRGREGTVANRGEETQLGQRVSFNLCPTMWTSVSITTPVCRQWARRSRINFNAQLINGENSVRPWRFNFDRIR